MTNQPPTEIVLACPPCNPDDYGPEARALWDGVTASRTAELRGATAVIYPGSIREPCDHCAITVALGPRQQEALANALVTQPFPVTILCFVCAAVAYNAMDGQAALSHLGNPHRPA